MKHTIFLFILATFTLALDLKIEKNWNLIGATEDIKVSSFKKECIDSVWTYENNGWKTYSYGNEKYPTISLISKGQGFWAHSSNGNCKLTIFSKELIIPPLLEPQEINGIKNFNLTIKESKHSFFESKETATLAFNGTYLGPTIRVVNGEKISINYTNTLAETTTVHGHGMHVPAKMDGGPHQKIEPSKTWSASYTVNQVASTNWYHPHLMGKTAEHVYKGLAGLIIVDDNESKTLGLPVEYGLDDIPLVLQDRFFDSNYQFNYNPTTQQIMHGYNGDVFITNGVIEPYFNTKAKKVRFRILNGSNSSVYKLAFDNNKEFHQIATDGSFLPNPVKLTSLILSPGERAEIIVDFSLDLGKKIVFKELNYNKIFLTINVTSHASYKSSLPNKLTTLKVYDHKKAVNTRTFRLAGRMGILTINGKTMDMSVINEKVPLNQIEIWEVYNDMGMEHNFHIHATHFMIIERNGDALKVAENEKGYKDVVYIPPRESVKFLVKMVDYKDEKLPYMYHCHFLEHEDAGMMGQFIVE